MNQSMIVVIVTLVALSCSTKNTSNEDAADFFIEQESESEYNVTLLFGSRARRALSTVKERNCGMRLAKLLKSICPHGCPVSSDLSDEVSHACCTKMCSPTDIVEGCCPK